MSADDSEIRAKISDAENDIDRLERMVTTAIFVTMPIVIVTYSALL